ncbi:MAG: ABC transporter ATP-binding protein [Chloroflexi bacterium]|nr:ABC transporter ATP-binding protein [Chloroflexota bacterium]
MALALEARSITKSFPGVVANDHVDFALGVGEIHALLGENGAGKTTLMNILYGLWQPDAGEIHVKGERVQFRDPSDAISRGIGMLHQHFMLVPVLSVAENIMLGRESMLAGVFLDRARVIKRIEELSRNFGLEVDPRASVKDLSVGIQQRVEILKILYRQADILILDEPTAVLTPQEAEELFKIMRNLAQQGKSIVFITHKLKEVMAVADRITVLRAGQVVGTTQPRETSERRLAAMMVGREVILSVERKPAQPGEVVLEVRDLHALSDRLTPALNSVSLEVRAGEILGVGGVQGNGQTELVETITGLRPVASGQIRILGQEMTNASPRQILESGTAHIPEDRQEDGLVLPFPVHDNLVLNTYYIPPYAHGLTLQEKATIATAEQLVTRFDVRTPSVFVPVATLSGGNQQKVIVARELSRPIRLLIAAQPTRGLDVGSIEYIHQRLVEKRDQGCAVLLVSTELDEILSLSDRIAVMFQGRIVATLDASQATREKLGLLMAGGHPG